MKKFIGVMLAVVLCACLTMPVAFAAQEDSAFAGIMDAIGSFASDKEALELENFDIGGLIGSFVESEKAEEDVDAQVKIEQAIQSAQDTVSSKVSSVGLDLSWLTAILGEDVDTDVVNNAFAAFNTDDIPELLTVIADAFGGAGIDMATFDVSALGEFDIVTLLGGSADTSTTVKGTATEVAPNDSSMATTELITGIFDTLRGGLTTVGIDVDSLLGSLGDNELINFFANMYIGFCGPVAEETTAATTSAPDTGDTASVFVALAGLCAATVAAGVCLKKKED